MEIYLMPMISDTSYLLDVNHNYSDLWVQSKIWTERDKRGKKVHPK